MTRQQKQDAIVNVIYYGIILAGAVLGLWLLRYLLPALYPFGVAYGVSLLLNPVMLFLEKRMGMPRKFGAFLLVLLGVAAVFAVTYLIIRRATEEVGRLAEMLSSVKWEDFAPLREKTNALLMKLPWIDGTDDLSNFWQEAEERGAAILENGIPGLQSGIELLTGVFTGIFDFVLAFFVTVIACYYMTVDRARIAGFVYGLFPKKAEGRIKSIKTQLLGTVGKYIKAYGLIALITFTELFVAFTVLRVDYSLLLAAIISLIDILPVLGTGSVLIPWALVCLFLQGDIYTGTGLIISYVAIVVIRQIAEPKIVGSYIGVHPLATLAAMFAGLKLFGFFGMLLLPVVLLGVKNMYKELAKPPREA